MSEARRQQPHSVSNVIVDRIIAEVWDPLEAKVILTTAALGGSDAPVSLNQILDYPELRSGAHGDGSSRDVSERLVEALHAAVAHGILMSLRDQKGTLWYAITTAENQRRARGGSYEIVDELALEPLTLIPERPDVFGLYEQNIGVVTPILADRLADALQRYPEQWVHDAIAESVAYNRRSWRYIQTILENWSTEGRTDETNRRDHEKHLDSEKYLRGKYAALFRKR